MGVLQQGFNQALTGATFLLQQTPGWQQHAEIERAKDSYRRSKKDLGNLRARAADIAFDIKDEYQSVPEEQQNKKWKEDMLKKTSTELKKVKGLEEGMEINVENMKNILRKNPALILKAPGALSIPSDRFNRSSQELARIQKELNTQKEQQMQYKTQLKQQDANELAAMGISKEAIEKARYN